MCTRVAGDTMLSVLKVTEDMEIVSLIQPVGRVKVPVGIIPRNEIPRAKATAVPGKITPKIVIKSCWMFQRTMTGSMI